MGDFEDKLNSILSSPKDMEKILGLARELSSSSNKDEPFSSGQSPRPDVSPSLGDIDPKLLGIVTRLFSAYSSAKNDKSDLVRSLTPYIRSDRKQELDKAVEIAKLAKIARIAFSEFSGGDGIV